MNLEQPSSAVKIDAHEIAMGGVGVHMFFVNDTVSEGDQAPMIMRFTPRDRGITFNLTTRLITGHMLRAITSARTHNTQFQNLTLRVDQQQCT